MLRGTLEISGGRLTVDNLVIHRPCRGFHIEVTCLSVPRCGQNCNQMLMEEAEQEQNGFTWEGATMAGCCEDKRCEPIAMRKSHGLVLWIVLAINAVMFIV